MANDSALGAIERLERALRRAEDAAGRLKNGSGDEALASRHRQLQEEVEAAIASLDHLIDTAEAG